MKVLVTGSKGFIGKNLCEALKNIRDGKDKREQFKELLPLTIYEYDRSSTKEDLDYYCKNAEFIFNLAGINRPIDDADFIKGNAQFTDELLNLLEKNKNTHPVMLASSTQASLEGRYIGSKYGMSKLEGERILREYSRRTGAPILIYRFPNVYGKWCKPNYNSVIATFCHNIANDIPIHVSDRKLELELLYIDDLVNSLLNACCRKYIQHEGLEGFCKAEPTDFATLGEIVDLIYSFKNSRNELNVPYLENGLSKKLSSTYQSYINPTDLRYCLKTNTDLRGSFTELLKTPDRGQVSLNVIAPNQTKGNHWHNTKWEKFIAISGEGIINQRKIGTDENGEPFPVHQYKLSANEPYVVETPTGYTHNIVNTSNEQDLIAIIWSNEVFDPNNPDTYYEEV